MPTKQTIHFALRTLTTATLFVLPSLLTPPPAGAQDIAPAIARAQKILAEIDTLLDSVQARQAGQVAPGMTVAGEWKNLFDGQSLAGWKRTEFLGGGNVHVEQAFRGGAPAIVVEKGDSLSGLNWTQEVPKTRYEIALEAMKIDGYDFLCGLTFPVGDSFASLILGGWGGQVVGISSINNMDASENSTTKHMNFPKDRWFKIRMRVTPTRLEAWVDDTKMVDQDITGKKISLRFGEISKSVPIGLSTYQTSAAYRNIRLRRLDKE